MKKIIIAAVLSLSSMYTFAGSVQQMVQQCHDVMICAECRVANDTRDYPNGRPILIKNVKYVVPSSDYDWIRNAGYDKASSGEFVMCERVRDAMAQPDSPRGLVARSSFNADYDGKGYCPPTVAQRVMETIYAGALRVKSLLS